MLKTNHRRRSAIVGSIVSAIVLGLAAWTLLNRQYIYDVYNFWQYQPSSAISSISSRASLSDDGRFYLYTSQAAVEDSSSFNNDCQRQEDKNAILGCYTNNRIYIYDVNNKQLDGIKEVTAAHEMLHAVWARTSDSEKSRIGVLLEEAYTQNVTPDLKARMDYYSRNEQGERTNELHSIIGTEVPKLSSELEEYYAKYFTDRSKVVGLYKGYSKVFDELSAQSEALYKQLVSLEKNIEKLKQAYQTEVANLNSDIQAFNKKATSGGFESLQEFNSEKAALNTRIDEVKAKEEQLTAQINLYNKQYKAYQALTVQSEALNDSIDSTVAPAPSL